MPGGTHLVAQWLGAAAVVVLLAYDAEPRLRGWPLVLLGLLAAVQMSRELASALSHRQIHPSTPLMSFWAAICFLHMVYFARSRHYSAALELPNTILIALFLLVLVASLTTEARFSGWREGLRDLGLGLSLPGLFGLGLGAAAFLQAGAAHWPTALGSRLLAAFVAGCWLAEGAAAVADRLGLPVEGRPLRVPATWRGLAARVATLTLVGAIASSVLGAPNLEWAALAGALAGVATWLARRAVDWLAALCAVDRFHGRLPTQISFFQGAYDRLYEGGLLDYAAGLVLALPTITLVLAAFGQLPQ